ncbi:MAG: pilus assembly PilX N-terminal domain-containing protein, partial [Vicinamibacterales bacterium]
MIGSAATARLCRNLLSDRGAALVLAIVAGLLLSAIGTSLVVLTSADVLIADNSGAGAEAFHGAEGALERTLSELEQVSDFTAVLDGTASSRFTDGPADGVRTLAGSGRLNLSEVVNEATCHNAVRCTEAAITAKSRDRPWGARNPRWRLFAYGPLDADISSGPSKDVYALVMVADDPSDADDDPWQDGGAVPGAFNEGAGVVLVRAEAYGRRSSRRIIEAVVSRPDLVEAAR